MVKKILRIIVSLVGVTIGAAFYIYLERIVPEYAPESLVLKIGLASLYHESRPKSSKQN
jgi:hypothetical protein